MKKSLIVFALLAALIPTSVSAASTGTSTLGTTASSTGTLDIVAPTSLTVPNLTYSPTGGVYGYANLGTVKVSDGRGTGDGWKLTVSSSPLKEIGGKGITFKPGSVTLYKPSALSTAGDTTNKPTITSVAYGQIDTAPFTIVTAAVGNGMGVWDITMPGIEIWADEYQPVIDKTTYPSGPTPFQATVTWTLSNTP